MTQMVSSELARYQKIYQSLDLTSLSGTETPEDIAALQDLATHPRLGHVAAVCVYPSCIPSIHTQDMHTPDLDTADIRSEPIKIATVVNFPLGNRSPAEVIQEIQSAISLGAEEIDLVIPYQDVRSGNMKSTQALLTLIQPYLKRPHILKLILESSELTPETLKTLCEKILALNLPIDFLKTSTGKAPSGGVTLEAAKIILSCIQDHHQKTGKWVGFKASGGVAEISQAQSLITLAEEICGAHYLSPKTFRIGASRLAKNIIAATTALISPPPKQERTSTDEHSGY